MNNKHKTVQAIVLIVIVSAISWNWVTRKINSIKYDGIWTTFQSPDNFAPDRFPQNLSFDYPQSWPIEVYENGGAKPSLYDRKISLDNPDFIFRSSENINIWWTKADDYWTEEDLLDWYVKTISTDSRENELTIDSFNQVQIGVYSYPALKTNRRGWQKTVFLVLVDQDAFAFIYTVDDSRNYSRDVVDRLINSIDFSGE